jgi:hypothetical protein
LFTQIEEAHGPEFARQVFSIVGGATARGWQGVHALRLRLYVEEQLLEGRNKEEIVQELLGTPPHLEAPDMYSALQMYRRFQQRIRTHLGLKRIAPGSLRKRIDRLLAERLPFDIFGK